MLNYLFEIEGEFPFFVIADNYEEARAVAEDLYPEYDEDEIELTSICNDAEADWLGFDTYSADDVD